MAINTDLYHAAVKHFQFELLPHQDELLNQLCDFYVEPNSSSLFILKGYAGTGKTTLLSAFVKALTQLKRKTVLLAPTGRAAKVFSQRSNKTAYTIHKKIYRKEKIAGGAIRLGVAPNLHTNTLFLVDEASMIGDYAELNDGSISSQNLLEDLINYVYNGKNCKMILIGDEGQLPPVGTDFSPALNLEYMQNHYFQLNIREYKLTEVVRQAEDSDILKNATALRSASDRVYPSFNLSGKNDLIRLDGMELEDALDSSYSHYGETETLVITRSNKRANLFNQQIRARIFWFEEKLVQNDLLMVVRNNYFWLGNQTEFGFIANGETLRVIRIKGRETLYGFDFVDALVELVDYPHMESLEVKILLEVIDSETPNLPRERLKELFFEVEKDYAYERNKRKRYELIMADPYFNALQVKYAYAVTCHKSQGGQWASVFVDQGFLTEDMLDKSYFRWLYTALTRATEKLYLVNFNDQFFEDENSK